MKKDFLSGVDALSFRRPLVIGTFTGSPSHVAALAVARSRFIDVVEFRMDTFAWAHGPGSVALIQAALLMDQLKKSVRKPILLTFRSASENGAVPSGQKPLTEAERQARLIPLLSRADAIDIEIRSRIAPSITKAARRQKCAVIHSLHDFSGCRLRSYESAAALSTRWKGDIFKIATTVTTEAQTTSFLEWGRALPVKRRVLIAMGEAGALSRVAGFAFGSLLTYGHLGAAAAPGQTRADHLGKTIHTIWR